MTLSETLKAITEDRPYVAAIGTIKGNLILKDGRFHSCNPMWSELQAVTTATNLNAEHQHKRLLEVVGPLAEALRKAKELAVIAGDWNLDEVEIDGKMVRTFSLETEFDAALENAGVR